MPIDVAGILRHRVEGAELFLDLGDDVVEGDEKVLVNGREVVLQVHDIVPGLGLLLGRQLRRHLGLVDKLACKRGVVLCRERLADLEVRVAVIIPHQPLHVRRGRDRGPVRCWRRDEQPDRAIGRLQVGAGHSLHLLRGCLTDPDAIQE